MSALQIVMDTNVLVAALRSKRGASYLMLQHVDGGQFVLNVSVPLVLEYEDAARRLIGEIPLTEEDIDDVLDYLCKVANHQQVFYLWRPFLRDPRDDMVLELAVAAGCDAIVTYNQRDFAGVDQFGLVVMTAKELLERTGLLP